MPTAITSTVDVIETPTVDVIAVGMLTHSCPAER